MQNDNSRLLQKSYISEQSYRDEACILAQKAASEAVILNPKTRAAELAETLMRDADINLTFSLNLILQRDFYLAAIRAERRKQAALNRAQEMLPGFEDLPKTITGVKGKRLPLLNANYTAVRAYYWFLMRGHSARRKNDPKIKETKKLLNEMRKASRRDKRITVREAILLQP